MTSAALSPVSMPMGPGVEGIYAGVDWISCTLPHDAHYQATWSNTCLRIIEGLVKGGEKGEYRKLNGYDGMMAGGCFYGFREDSAYCQLAGHYAADNLDAIWRDDLHVSRVDVQATVRYRTMPSNLGPLLYRESTEANATLPVARRRRIWYMSGNDGGYTLYIGSPKSDQRARIYNKAVQAEKPEYVRCWRFEVEGRNQYAQAWIRKIVEQSTLRPQYCAQLVLSWLLLRGVDCEWGRYVPLLTLPLIKELPTDAEKRLKWLTEQVRPAVAWLVANGFEKQVMEALDL